uniref:Putative secreted protein n=1 Tax=Ixodes ricinus TaxID=34613 RepID=A0A6B0UM78_IXORI
MFVDFSGLSYKVTREALAGLLSGTWVVVFVLGARIVGASLYKLSVCILDTILEPVHGTLAALECRGRGHYCSRRMHRRSVFVHWHNCRRVGRFEAHQGSGRHARERAVWLLLQNSPNL